MKTSGRFMLTRAAAARIRCERGVNRLGILLFGLLIAGSVFTASQVFPFYYYYWEIQGLMEAQAAKAQVFTDHEIRQNLMASIRKMKLPISDPSDLKINRTGNRIIIDLSYQEVLYIDLGEDRVYDLYVFRFNPHVDQVY